MSSQIKRLATTDVGRWNDFVQQHPDSTFFHLAEWKDVLEQAFGHATHYLYSEANGEITAVLPLAEVKSWLFGHSLVSTPFCVYGGVLANDDKSARLLVEKACELARELNVDYLELRNRQRQQESWPCKELYVTFRKTISDNDEENLKAIPRKQRAVVRKSLELGLDHAFDDKPDDFYTAYSTSVRNLGTPVFSAKYFQTLKSLFKDRCDILTIRKDGELVASVMSFYFKDEVLPYYGGGTAAARSLKGNDYMYWQLMCESVKRGLSVFDYGRSKEGTGSYSFKKNWGFVPEPLFYEYYLVKATEMPDVNPLNPKYQLMINTWQKLPLWLSQKIGPLVSKYLG